jgi:2-haloacid dehalogenase
MTPKAVIFDIGNVLIEWQPERFYDAAIGQDRRKAMFQEVDLHGMNDQIDRGASFADVVYETAEKYPQWRAEIRMWHDRWIEIAAPAIDHSVRLLRALRAKGVPVFVLTNIGVRTFEIAAARYPFLGEFDHYFISGQMQTIKPEPQIYEMVEQQCGLSPKHLLFADDRADNITAAAARGWATHAFKDPQRWADTLVGHGLLSKNEAK